MYQNLQSQQRAKQSKKNEGKNNTEKQSTKKLGACRFGFDHVVEIILNGRKKESDGKAKTWLLIQV